MSKKKTLIISLSILVVSAVITFLVFITQPTSKPDGATKQTAMLVEVITVNRAHYRPTVEATGTVQPSKDITLSPRVGGEVVEISDGFTPGAFVKKGEMLLRIDPSDYQNTLALRKSDLLLAQADLKVEMGRQDVAEKDYQLVGDDLSPENKALVLRKPQLEQARANVASARASLKQAQLNLERTVIRAPFDAHIITRNANVGSQVAPGDNLGRLVGMDEYWVIANVPIAKINRLTFSEEEEEKGSFVKILNENIWPTEQYRTGKLFRMVGALDNQTRLARVIVTVPDPLARKTDSVPPLMIGTFVETHIQATEIKDVVRLDRNYLRKDNTVWVMEEGKLQIRKADVIFQDAVYAYIKKGLEDGDKVVTTNLSTVVEGSSLRLEREEPDSANTNE